MTSLAIFAETVPFITGATPVIPWGRLAMAFLFCITIAVVVIVYIRRQNGRLISLGAWRANLGLRTGEESYSSERMYITQRINITPTSQLILLKRGKLNYLLHLTATGAIEIDRFKDEIATEPE